MRQPKESLTAEQVYKKNRKKQKMLAVLGPVAKWGFLALAALFFLLTIKNSVGNITEILRLLDKDVYTGEQLSENYRALIERWGEWEIVGENAAGLVVRYVDIRNALFSGMMTVFLVLTVISLFLSVLLGKIVFPQLAKYYETSNAEMVNLETLKSAQKINEMTEKKKGEWF